MVLRIERGGGGGLLLRVEQGVVTETLNGRSSEMKKPHWEARERAIKHNVRIYSTLTPFRGRILCLSCARRQVVATRVPRRRRHITPPHQFS